MAESTEINQVRNNKSDSLALPSKSPVLYSALFVLVVLGLLGAFINFSFFNIKRVVVKGNHTVSKEAIILATRISRNQSIFTFDRLRARRAILSNPYIAKVGFDWAFPDQLLVSVVERYPSCVVRRGNTCYLIGNDCAVLGVVNQAESVGLPLVCGVHFKKLQIGKRICNSALDTAITILDHSDRRLRSIVRKIDLAHCRLYLETSGSTNLVMVELGNMERLTKKMANLRAVLAKNQTYDMIRIDLRIPEISTITAGKR